LAQDWCGKVACYNFLLGVLDMRFARKLKKNTLRKPK